MEIVVEEIVEFRLSSHDEQISSIRKHSHEVNESLMGINFAIKGITDQMDAFVSHLEKISSRLKELEDDYSRRKYQSIIFSSIRKNWPIILFGIAIVCSIDVKKILTLLNILH